MTAPVQQSVLDGASPPRRHIPPAARDDWARTFGNANRLAWFHAPMEGRVVSGRVPAGTPAQSLEQEQPHHGETVTAPRSRGRVQQVADVGMGGASGGRVHATSGLASTVASALLSVQAPAAAGATHGVAAAMAYAAVPRPLAGVPGPGLPTASARMSVAPIVPDAPRAPLRLHLDHQSNGLVLYVGMDAVPNAPALSAASLASQLRRAWAFAGQRLAGVVCNGVPVDPEFPFQPKEP